MGRSNNYLFPFYKGHINPNGKVALLGFTENGLFDGDLYDLRLDNWDINSDWKLKTNYDTIISLRCPYFAKKPLEFIKKCHENLNEGGKIYLDWGLGDHWRFPTYKIGWIKAGEHEYAYRDDNYLWSGVWDDSFLKDPQFKLFCSRVKKFGYGDIKKSIYQEVPEILELNLIKKYFNISYNIMALWDDKPQLYVLISGTKNEQK